MTDSDLLKNTRSTRNTTGMGWGFSLCTVDDDDSDSEPEDASTGSHNSPAPSPDLPISEGLRLVRDLDLGARQDTAIFNSNPWTIAKLRAAARKPPSISHSIGHSGLPSALPQALVSTPIPKARSILDPHPKSCVPSQPTLCSKKPRRKKEELSPRTRRKLRRKPSSVANPAAVGPNPDHLPGPPSVCLDPPEIYTPSKFSEATFAHPRPSPVENCTAHEQEGIQPSSLGAHSKGPYFSSPVSVSPVALLGHIDPSISPVKQPPLHYTADVVASPNRFSFPDRLSNPLAFLPRSPTSDPSHLPTTSPVKHRSPGALSANLAGTKRKRWPSPSPSPLRPPSPVGNHIPNPLLTMRRPAERVLPPETPIHRQRASVYDSRVFILEDEEWSTLPQNKPRISVSKTPISVMQNSFRIPMLKLPGIGNQASKKSWLLTTFQPPPPLKVPNLMSTSESHREPQGRPRPDSLLETMNNSR